MTTRRARSTTPVRQRLLDAADELFYDQGIAGTGVDGVLARSGAAVGSLYGHFGGKDGLVVAYLGAREERWRTAWDTEVERHDDATARVLAIFDALATWARDGASSHGCAHAAALAQLVDDHPARQAALAHKNATRDRLVELVGQAEPQPCESPVPAEALADDLLLVYEGALVALSVGNQTDPIARARRLAGTLLDQHLTSRRLPADGRPGPRSHGSGDSA